MGSPITWRNVDGPNLAAAAQPLALAGQSVNNAFDQFNRVIQQRQAFSDNLAATAQDTVKQNYLDALALAKSPEQLAALQASGQLDDLQAGMTAQTRGAIRGADDARLASVRTNESAANTFNDQLRARAEAPIIGAIKDRALRGDTDGAMADLAASSLYDKSGVEAAIHEIGRSRIAESRADQLAPFALQSAQRGAELGGLQVTAAKRAESDALDSRAADALVNADAAVSYQDQRERQRSLVGAADAFQLKNKTPIPRRLDGSVDIARLDSDTYDKFNSSLKRGGLPSLEDVQYGDTRAAKVAVEKLRASGAKATDIARIQSQMPAMFNTAPIAPVGNDADILATRNRADQALDADNQMKYGTVATPASQDALTSTALDTIGKVTKPGTWREEAARETILKKLSTDGIDVNGVRVLPNAAQLRQIVAGAQNSWWGGNGVEFDKAWDAWKNNPDNITGAKEAVKMQRRKFTQGIFPEVAAGK